MERVRRHSLLPASHLPLPQHPPPQNHMQHQQYPALVWDPLCPTCLVPGPQPWGEGAGWGGRGKWRRGALARNSCLPLPHQAQLGGTKGAPSSRRQPQALTKALATTARAGVPTPRCPHTALMRVSACCHGMAVGQQGLRYSQTAALWSACERSQGLSSQG